MSRVDFLALAPFLILAGTSLVVMIAIAIRRNHIATFVLTVAGMIAALGIYCRVEAIVPHPVTTLFIIDAYGLLFVGLMIKASLFVTLLSFGYFRRRGGQPEEFYLLLLLATLGACVVAVSRHFVSFFVGLELLSVALYVLLAYPRGKAKPLEAGVKYLILAAASSAFLLFGMALFYANLGTMDFAEMARLMEFQSVATNLIWLGALAFMITGIGFKLALVPFHMWTPDVYQGAPAPATAFVATVSKGALVAFLVRYFLQINALAFDSIWMIFAYIAVASMFLGNLAALRQSSVKRLLAYSSIAHLGYLLVAFLAGGDLAAEAVTFYLAAYIFTTLGAFGVITVLSAGSSDVDAMEDFQGLFWRYPWHAAVFTTMLLSLAGIPLTAGFVGKFYVVATGVGQSIWWLLFILVINSTIGIYYYLRVVVAMFSAAPEPSGETRGISRSGSVVLALILLAVLWMGIYPPSVMEMIRIAVGGMF